MASGLGPQVRELKIGRSFTSAKNKNKSGPKNNKKANHGQQQQESFHTIRYDFKPASVDENRRGELKVAEDQKGVSVTVPNLDGNQTSNYGGHIKEANKKDCVLIIDHETGEITIERLTSQILVKKTRADKVEKDQLVLGGGMNPNSTLPGKPAGKSSSSSSDQFLKRGQPRNSPASNKSSPNAYNFSMGSGNNRSRNGSRSNSPSFFAQQQQQQQQQQLHSNQNSQDGFSGISVDEMLPDFTLPSRIASPMSAVNAPAAATTANAATAASNSAAVNPNAASNGGNLNTLEASNDAADDLGLSDSSSSDSSSDSDDSDDSDSNLDEPKKPIKTATENGTKIATPNETKKNNASHEPSMPDDFFSDSLPTASAPISSSSLSSSTGAKMSQQSKILPKSLNSSNQSSSSSSAISMPSMPQMLNEDLQLSESDSDSSMDL